MKNTKHEDNCATRAMVKAKERHSPACPCPICLGKCTCERENNVRKLLVDVLPGEVFEYPNSIAPGAYGRSTSLCLKLHEQKVINLDMMRAWRTVDQKEEVNVLGKFSELFSFDHLSREEAKIKP